MAGFEGKWKLTETHNDDEFLKSLGYSQEARELCKPVNDPKNNVVAEYITKDPKEIKNIMYVDGKEMFTQCTPLGCDFDVTDPTGATSKIRKHTLEGNKIFLEQELEGNHVATYETTVDGDRMYEVMTNIKDGTKATRTMMRLVSEEEEQKSPDKMRNCCVIH